MLFVLVAALIVVVTAGYYLVWPEALDWPTLLSLLVLASFVLYLAWEGRR